MCIFAGRREDGRGAVGHGLVLRGDGRHVHVRSAHSEAGAHPFGPMPHIGKLVHGEGDNSTMSLSSSKLSRSPGGSKGGLLGRWL